MFEIIILKKNNIKVLKNHQIILKYKILLNINI